MRGKIKKFLSAAVMGIFIFSFPVYAESAITVTWRADLNRDGLDDKILVKIMVGESDTAAKLYVYRNNTSILLYSAEAAYAHAGWNGFYLYEDENGKPYLLNWLPQMYQGYCSYSYEVFSFGKNGEKVVLAAESLEFDSMEVSGTLEGAYELIRYVQRLNVYLEQSELLMDTDGGELKYGMKSVYTDNKFMPAWLFDPQ